MLLQLIGIKLSNSVLWYVWHLIIFLLIFYLLRNLKKQQRLLIFIFIYLIYLMLAVKFDIGIWWYTATACILIGLYFADEDTLKIGLSSKKINFIIIIWLSVLIIGELFVVKNIKLLAINDNYYNVGLQMMIIPLFLLAIRRIFYKKKLKIKILKFLGVISYEIYLYHMNIWTLVQYFLEEKYYYFRVVITIIMTIIVAYFIKKITNKILSNYFI